MARPLADYVDDDKLVQLPRYMGPTIHIDWENPVETDPIRAHWDALMIQEARVLSMSPAVYLQKLLEHLNGSAEYTALELWEISNKSVGAFRRMRKRLQQRMIEEDANDDEQDQARSPDGRFQGRRSCP